MERYPGCWKPGYTYSIVLMVSPRYVAVLLHSARGVSPQNVAVLLVLWQNSTPEKEGHPLFRRFIGRAKSRSLAASAGVEKGSSQLNRYRTYLGLLRGGVFQGGNWSDFSP